MTITAYNVKRIDSISVVTVTSDLAGTIYYHWYKDGAYDGMNLTARKTFFLPPGSEARIVVQDTIDPEYDPFFSAPDGYPNFRTIHWVRAIATDVDHYKVEQQKDSGGWPQVAIVEHEENKWSYMWVSGILTDLSSYEWKITPVDIAGNDGSTLSFTAEKIVRVPDAPDFEFSYDAGTDKITFAEL